MDVRPWTLDPRFGRRWLLQVAGLCSVALAVGCGLLPGPAQPAKAPVVGFFSASSQAAFQAQTEGFRQGLRELGYVESQNIVMEYRFADGRDERLTGLAAELVGLQVSVIFAADTSAALAARSATQSIPIVSVSGDPVALGLVASLARPGGNVTGLSLASALIAGKRLELLKEFSPAASRVVALWYAPSPASAVQLREAQDAAPRLGLQLQAVGIQGPDNFETAFQSAARERADGLYVAGSPEMNAQRARIVEFAASTQLPAMYAQREWVEGGGLMSYGVNFSDVQRRAATYVDRILKGAKPADLPVEQPTKFDFIINLKTAEALGITVPPSVLARATEVIR